MLCASAWPLVRKQCTYGINSILKEYDGVGPFNTTRLLCRYASRQLSCELCRIPSWKAALCGPGWS